MSICDDNSEMSHHHIGVTSHSCTFLVCNCNDCLAWTWKRSGRTAMSLAWLPWPGYGSQIPCHLMTEASHHVLHMDIWLALIQLAQDRVLHKFIKNHGYCTVLPSLQWILLTKRDSLQEIMSINSYDQHECINRHTLQPCTDFLCAATQILILYNVYHDCPVGDALQVATQGKYSIYYPALAAHWHIWLQSKPPGCHLTSRSHRQWFTLSRQSFL